MATPTGQLSFRKIWRNIYWMGEEAAVLAAFAKMDGSRSLKFTFCSRFSTLVTSRTLTLLSWVGAVISSWCNFITVLYVGHFLLEEDDKFLDKEVKHVMFLKLESWKKAWSFLKESLELQRSFNLRRSDRAPSSFGEVVLPSAIQLLSGDDRAFAIRSTALIHRPGRSDRTPLSFGEAVLPLAIQLLSENDWTFAVRSTALVKAIGHLPRLERWYCHQRSNFYQRTIGLLPSDPPPCDPTSIGGRLGFCRQIHHPGRSDRVPSSFGEVILLSAIQLLSRDDRAFAVRSTALVGTIEHLRPFMATMI
ncbi:hypothetical protein E6C27_scaffold754G00470 [Cucumis melo var. makuwa]|uniref:Uncharacterized protein n=1 Tax=Cucumis melo var. makuwa TaxID=1194695 RepID=A0A5A7TW61_CUCMM|nr:hypothetical protein E6C27_scaffold754G00470 [Cucumis melo var. makuwa]